MRTTCAQFPLVTVIQLLKEAGVDSPDASAIASDKPSEVASDAENMDLVNTPATFDRDYEGDETAW